jgi:Flp pilus assembly protein TadB
MHHFTLFTVAILLIASILILSEGKDVELKELSLDKKEDYHQLFKRDDWDNFQANAEDKLKDFSENAQDSMKDLAEKTQKAFEDAKKQLGNDASPQIYSKLLYSCMLCLAYYVTL